ncbi:phosphotransferase family protein [Actinophytocola sp.]|uniref:phosphotransferase family protein n=1 Tax=Actinophytocola sp. TaxID=1872138 RepID=UPI003D6C2A73
MTVASTTPHLAGGVAAELSAVLGRTGLTARLVRLSAGASRETYRVRAAAGEWSGTFVLQRERRGSGLGGTGVCEQVRLLRESAAAGVPVPTVLAWDTGGERLGAPFVLSEFVAGETVPRRILRAPELAAARAGFAGQCGRILARLHAIPTGGLSWLDSVDQLDRVVAWIDGSGEPHPAFELAIDWLRAHRPPEVAKVLVHGDFRAGNLIVGPDGIRAVLDWELAHLGDPAEDLAWLCLKAWRFRGPGVVGGMGEPADLLDAYAREGGRCVEPARLFWWQVLGTLKWGAICQRQARVHLGGESRSVELAAIGRRVCETEYDLLRMLP